MPTILSPQDATAFARDLFIASGVDASDAETAAASFTWASQRGIDTHGITRVPRYLEMFDSGVANREPKITVETAAAGIAVVDADFAPGPIALGRAVSIVAERTRTQGVAAVAVRNTVHTGAAGYYAAQLAEQGLIGIVLAAGSPMMSYEGAVGASVATSPLAIAVPAGEGKAPVLLDMASSLIAMGKIMQAKRTGEELPAGSATTADGAPTTDPQLAAVPTPLGGAKGSGLSLEIELLTSVLVGAPILTAFHAGTKKHRQNALVIGLNPALFGSAATFADNVDATVDTIHDLPRAAGVERVLVPGERSAEVSAKRAEAGIPIGDKLWAELTEAAERLGVAIPGAVTA